ncbi:hypothetical protein CFO_g2548 [Ceratocystis platani]|uniref:Uncharacterized protein n=1 Tax=Ceratocystis fimbriata f. sp. platani TaxID=88771 RepID=A0A0F8B4C1_CERFI|nr:hypothetical protein CFO_g2548 [Ceratocystis platani]
MRFSSIINVAVQISVAAAQITESMLAKSVDSMTLKSSFNPIKEAYWTGLPHHRRTPFAVSPDGKTGYIAYLDASETDVHVQALDPTTFKETGTAVTVTGAKEAGGLVAHNDGFALLANEALPSGTSGAPPDNTPVAVLYRYDASGTQTWKTFLGGPNIDSDNNLASPDINGDLVFSEAAGYYAAYIVVTAYSGSATGHFGDAIRYITTDGKLENIPGASSSWGCSHNTGIALEAADAPPFASLCAEDQGALWLNTKSQGMMNDNVKVSNEHVINGASNEAMGGMSGSYSGMARFGGAKADSNSYIFTWVSRGAIDLTANTWMGDGYTKSENRTVARNVAIATFSDKNTLVGEEATSVVGSADGDSQVNWVTNGSADCQNAHAATFDATNALVTWEQIDSPQCNFDAMGCQGAFSGTYYQQIGSDGKKVGEPLKSMDSFVAGDMVTMPDGRICWPYVAMDWKLDGPANAMQASASKMSFACIGLSGGGSGSSGGSATGSSTAPASSAAPSTASSAAPNGATPTEYTAPTENNAPTENSIPTEAAAPTGYEPSGPEAPAAPPSTFETVVTPSAAPTDAPEGVPANPGPGEDYPVDDTPAETATSDSAANTTPAPYPDFSGFPDFPSFTGMPGGYGGYGGFGKGKECNIKGRTVTITTTVY